MFTDNLVECRRTPMDARRAVALPLVAGAHAALAAALVLASVWSLRYVSEPPVIIVPNIPVVLVPPPAGGPRPDQPAPAVAAPSAASEQVPWEIPEAAPVVYAQEAVTATGSGQGVEGGIDDWIGPGGGGWGGDAFTGVLKPPRPPEPDLGPLQIGGDIRAPVRMVPLTPLYPEAARKAGKQGVVVLRLTIDREGRVTEVREVAGLPFGLTQAAMEAARKLRFQPAYRASTGRPVECYFDLSVEFRIN